VELVIHLAALSLVPESMRDPGRYFTSNVGGVVTLLERMRHYGVTRLLFSSSAAVYGHPQRVPIDEDAVCAPVNPYGESKWMIERILYWYGEVHDLTWTALRYFNGAGAAYGMGEDHRPETHLIPLALDVAQGRREDLVVYGSDYPTPDGTCVRDYVHVRDLAEAHLLAVEELAGGRGGVYNLGGGEGHSVRQVIEAVARITGSPVAERPGPRRPGDPPVLVASADRARRVLGWRPGANLEQIISSAWEWRQRHPNGYAA
jgi:UDP-glucose 4-epimerase